VTKITEAGTDPATAAEELTIDALAQRTGMTVRNIRAYQSRGLLPPPEVRGRTGYYGAEHVARIELVRELQADGFNLEAIKRILDAGGEISSADVLRFTRAVHEPFEDEEPEILTGEDLAAAVGTSENPELLARAIKIGLVREVGEGSFELRSPQLARAGAELAALGLPVEAGLEVMARLRRHADGVARAFVELFIEQVWKPFDEEGRPPERWPEIVEALERLRPLAAESLLAIFKLAMTDAVDRAFGREMERVRRDPDAKSRRRGRRRSSD
jgi:DNA-binding transcriptional MerR regulator